MFTEAPVPEMMVTKARVARSLRFYAIVCALSLVLVACNTSDDSSDGSSQEGSDSEEPTAIEAPFAVGMSSETFVDDSRPTDAVAGFDGAPDRTLPTTIYYPAASGEPGAAPVADAEPAPGPFPFILFSHGVDSLGTNYADLLVQWVEAGYVVAAPNYPLGSSDTPGDIAVITDAPQQAIDASFVTDSVLALDGVGSAIDPETYRRRRPLARRNHHRRFRYQQRLPRRPGGCGGSLRRSARFRQWRDLRRTPPRRAG